MRAVEKEIVMRASIYRVQRGLAVLGLSALVSWVAGPAPVLGGEMDGPLPVSPGGTGEVLAASGPCPTFSWAGAREPGDVDLVVSRLEEAEVPILAERVPGGATSWTPPGERCFEPGRYVWFLRRVDAEGGTWSEGRAFEVASLPSREEIERSLVTLRRYLTETGYAVGGAPLPDPKSGGAKEKPPREGDATAVRTVAPVSLGVAAITGHVPGTVGSHVGVVGTVDSPDGAGLAGQNTAGGADLYLAGPVAAEVTESEWTLDGAGTQTFGFSNPSGAMKLQVQSEDVLTAGDVGATVAAGAHDHLGELWQGAGHALGLYVDNQESGGAGLRGDGPLKGVIGRAGASTGGTIGVEGLAFSPDQGAGVAGQAIVSGGGGKGYGVRGSSNSSGGAGGVFVNTGGGSLIEGFATSDTSGTPLFRVDDGGNVFATSFSGGGGAAEPPSLFGPFGGASSTDRTISGTENLGVEVAYYRNLTIPLGSTLVVDKGIALVAVSGTCDIAGTIDARGLGRVGGVGQTTSGPSPGAPGTRADLVGTGYGMSGGLHRVPVPLAVAGGGGGGGAAGNAPQARGGDGGGGESSGGEGGYPQDFGTYEGRDAGVDWGKRLVLTHGASGPSFPDLTTDDFAHLLYYPGAGGGAGAVGAGGGTGGSGGDGGGVIYLECRTVSFTGTVDIRGDDGAAGSGNAGGGGGGGGGIGIIRSLDVTSNTGTVLYSGGTGGAGSGAVGGDGGNGRLGYFEIVDL